MEKDLVCDKCNGTGIIFDRKKKFWELKWFWFKNHAAACSKCNGIGTVNWIDNITGECKVPKKFSVTYHSVCYGCITALRLCEKCRYFDYRNYYTKPSLRSPKLWY